MSCNVDFFVDTLLESNEEKSQTTILDSAEENLACELASGQIQIQLTKCKGLRTRSLTVSFSMRFPGHETVSVGNRVRVNVALVEDSRIEQKSSQGQTTQLPRMRV